MSPACRAPNDANPPFGGGDATVRGGKAPKSQTTSVKNIENGVLRLRWSAFWAQRCLAWCVGRTQTAEYARHPLDTHVNPQIGALNLSCERGRGCPGQQIRVWGTTTRSCPTGYSLVSARHLETAFFRVEPAESFTP